MIAAIKATAVILFSVLFATVADDTITRLTRIERKLDNIPSTVKFLDLPEEIQAASNGDKLNVRIAGDTAYYEFHHCGDKGPYVTVTK